MRKQLFIYILLIVTSCNHKLEEIEYYEDGKIESKCETINGIRNGICYYYYPNGKLESKTLWKDGLQDGVSEFYYPDGKLEVKSDWKQGKMHGLSFKYYSNGQLRRRTNFVNDTITGELFNYTKDGKLADKKIYNKLSEWIYAETYDSTGKLDKRYLLPIFEDENDTLNVNEPFRATVSFGYKLGGEISMLVGPLDDNSELIDTTAIIKPDREGKFHYSTNKTKPGNNMFSIIFKHTPNKGDTLSADGLIARFKYYVREKPAGLSQIINR